jgi:hypothetical protein
VPAFALPFAIAWALTRWSSAASDVAVLVLGFWSVWWYAREHPLGKRLLGLTAYGTTGRRRLLRGAWAYLVVPAFVWWWLAPLLAADVLATFVDRERRALHDLAAGTVVLEPTPEAREMVRIRLLPPDLRRRVAADAYERAGLPPRGVETSEEVYEAFQLPMHRLYEREAELARIAGHEADPDWTPSQELLDLQRREDEARERSLAAAEAEASLHSRP